jgi:hypothetical protein
MPPANDAAAADRVAANVCTTCVLGIEPGSVSGEIGMLTSWVAFWRAEATKKPYGFAKYNIAFHLRIVWGNGEA